jgi:hypothetical protein
MPTTHQQSIEASQSWSARRAATLPGEGNEGSGRVMGRDGLVVGKICLDSELWAGDRIILPSPPIPVADGDDPT